MGTPDVPDIPEDIIAEARVVVGLGSFAPHVVGQSGGGDLDCRFTPLAAIQLCMHIFEQSCHQDNEQVWG